MESAQTLCCRFWLTGPLIISRCHSLVMIKNILMSGCSTVLQQQTWYWVLQCSSRFGSAIHHCTSAQGLQEGKAWFQLVRCFLACQAENLSSHQAAAWSSSQLCPIRQREMPKTPLHGILRTTAHINSWLPPRVHCKSDVSLQYQSSTETSVYNQETSLYVFMFCFPWGAQSSTGPSPSFFSKTKPSQLVQGLFPEKPHKAVWQQLPSYWSHQAWWDRPGLSKKGHLRMQQEKLGGLTGSEPA